MSRVTVWIQRFTDRPFLVLQWIDPETGARKSKSAKTAEAKEAERARADLEYELNNGMYQETSTMSWESFREKFEAEFVPAKADDTQTGFAATLNLFEKVCAPKRLRSITERTLSMFAAGMRKLPGRKKGSKGMMESTIKVRLQFIHTVLTWAADQKMIPAVPKTPKVDPPVKYPQPVPAESFERLFAKAGDDAQMKAYILCGWLAGLRLSEAYKLEWDETETAPYVDFARNRIVVPAASCKAKKDQWVPIDRELREALLALPRRRKRVFHFTKYRGKPLLVTGVSQRVSGLAKKAGVRLTMHTLRKGFGCRYAGKQPAQVVQKLMRHASIKTTMDYYANIDAAVDAAVLGNERNTERNSGNPSDASRQGNIDATLDNVPVNSPSAS